MKSKILWYILAMFSLSCRSKETNSINETVPLSDTAATVKNEIINKKELSFDNFGVFWNAFREAVIKNDTSQIHQLTKIPFKTRGPMDSDPVKEYNRKEFLKVFHAFLQQPISTLDSEGNLVETTQFAELKKTELSDNTYFMDNWARVGDLEFSKEEGSWLLTYAYLEYPTIEKLEQE